MNAQSPVIDVNNIDENHPVIRRLKSPLMHEVGKARETLPVKTQGMEDAKPGHVMLLDWMGSDDEIIEDARTSYDGKGKSDTTTLINYLMEHEHSSPFEMSMVKLHLRMPIFVARQWIRHRTASVNEWSGRYIEMPTEFYIPALNRSVSASHSGEFIDNLSWASRLAADGYEKAIKGHVEKEVARIVLPPNLMTEFRWTIDIRNLLHFLKLRSASNAQWEIRQYANEIAEIVKIGFPKTWDAFDNFVLKSVRFSRDEICIIKNNLEAPKEWSERKKRSFVERAKMIGVKF